MNWILFYVLIGFFYTAVNAWRGLDPDGDFMLVLTWVIFWPVYVGMLIGKGIKKLFSKGIKRLRSSTE